MINKICTSCGFLGAAKHQGYHVFLIDVLVWSLGLFVIFYTHLLLFILFPALWTIYHVSTFRTECPDCHSKSMVALVSHKGKSVLEQAYHRLS